MNRNFIIFKSATSCGRSVNLIDNNTSSISQQAVAQLEGYNKFHFFKDLGRFQEEINNNLEGLGYEFQTS
ncbi:MAG: hypothetical protein DSM107014_09185 [Gomphosphaeria aponina SAG 52.96 = DSM 107014]|uniref:Uncharacterized protein n=1 Tax=Gomphosphaeria aponina SAG 52.96 = DSM 107014 TaxID=1521640 RepID=A0A941JPU3_9CHRO|nr:hypothetical protein [Gomphosphaeria aponina SAG 52.96 = DSM 107014]